MAIKTGGTETKAKRAPRKPKAEAAPKPQLQRPKHVRASAGEIPPLPPIRNLTPAAPVPEPITETPSTLQVTLPATQVGLIVGLDMNGNIYHTFVGEGLNVVQLAGLQKYADALVSSLINKVLPANAR